MMHTTKANRNRWEFPGGKVDTDEEEKKAAERECEEETSIIVRASYFVCAPKIDIDDHHWEIAYYYALRWEGIPHNMESEKCDFVGFIDRNAISSLPQIPRLCIDVVRSIEYDQSRPRHLGCSSEPYPDLGGRCGSGLAF